MSENLFRIGGHYRRNDQTVIKVGRVNCASHVSLWAEKLPGRSIGEMQSEDGYAKGYVCLNDGRYVKAEDAEHPQNLIPGELTQRNGQWVAADALIGPFGSGATLTTKGGYITGRNEPEPDPEAAQKARDHRPRTENETIFALVTAMRAAEVAAANAAKGGPLPANANLLRG